MTVALVNLVLTLVVLGFVYWVVQQVPFIVEPWRRIVLALIVLIGIIVLVKFALGIAGIGVY